MKNLIVIITILGTIISGIFCIITGITTIKSGMGPEVRANAKIVSSAIKSKDYKGTTKYYLRVKSEFYVNGKKYSVCENLTYLYSTKEQAQKALNGNYKKGKGITVYYNSKPSYASYSHGGRMKKGISTLITGVIMLGVLAFVGFKKFFS